MSKVPPGPYGTKELGALMKDKATFESTYVGVLANNDATVIAGIVRQSLVHCGNVIVCDDGSTDRTADEAMRAGARVVRHDTSLGKRRSMSDLVNEVILRSPSGFVLLEREGFGHVDDIPKVLEPIMKDEADIAVATDGMNGSKAVDAGVTAMNSKGLFTLYRKGFFSAEGASPQTAIDATAGLRARAVSLKTGEARVITQNDRVLAAIRPKGETRPSPRSSIRTRDLLAAGIPAVVFTAGGIWLLAEFLINYNYTGQIPVPMGIRAVIGFTSILFGLAFMVSYYVVYYSKRADEVKKD